MGLSQFHVGITSNLEAAIGLMIEATAKTVNWLLKLLRGMFCQCCACVSDSATLQLPERFKQQQVTQSLIYLDRDGQRSLRETLNE